MKHVFSITAVLVITGLFLYFFRSEIKGPVYPKDLWMMLAFTGMALFAYYIYAGIAPGKSTVPFFEKPVAGFLLVLVLSTLLFFSLPNLVFDDAAIVLRYMDNFGKGHFFKYNATDAPIYGISGFIHGLLGGLLVYLHIAGSEQALLISNYIGFVFASWFIYLTYKTLITSRGFAFAAWCVTIVAARSFLDVANSGLETPLHLAFVMGAVYFFISRQKRTFYFFSALMVVSKLDAVPVAAALFFYYVIVRVDWKSGKTALLKELKWCTLYFLLPVLAGMLCLIALFGSPLPQSAFAKLHYHPHPKDSWFPFLKYFENNTFKLLLLVAGLLLWFINILEVIWKRNHRLLIHGLFGSLFIAGMALYYFYNPLEQMIWYYAMPELLLIIQVVYGTWYYFTTYTFIPARYARVGLLLFLFSLSMLGAKDTLSSLWALQEATDVAETERTAIGAYIRDISTTQDTLLSSHGLPTRFFKGYVIDLSGLNSKLATQYHLNADSIIAGFKPTLIINHAFPILPEILNRYNYKVLGVYRNITLFGNYSWVLLKRMTPAGMHKIKLLDTGLNKQAYFTQGLVIKMPSRGGVIILKDTFNAAEKQVHIGIAATNEKYTLHAYLYKNGVFVKTTQQRVSAFSTRYSKINDVRVDISGADSVVFTLPQAPAFEIVEPIYELSDRKYNDFLWQKQ